MNTQKAQNKSPQNKKSTDTIVQARKQEDFKIWQALRYDTIRYDAVD